jgi:hypothetical protein
MIDYQVVKQWSFDEVRHSYGERECMLYALAVGLGADPKSPGELRYTYEKDLRAVPTMHGLCAYGGSRADRLTWLSQRGQTWW